ncbi:MAG: NusG domain II-containing protein [Calditerrivibrio sp.]|nr:NusG domain II-containing protein [Calditerrivibrio sp.]
MRQWTKLKAFDIIVLILFLVLPIYAIIKPVEGEKRSFLIVDGVKHPLDLSKNQVLDLTEFGKRVKMEIKDGKVRFLSSDCKDKICLQFGYIETCGESAVCVPNRVAIVIECEKRDYDGVTR